MANDVESVDDYLATQPETTGKVLARVRTILRTTMPDADEVITYKIPTYKLHGTAVLFFAGWKNHFSFYPANGALLAAFERELAPYEVNDKGTIRFPLSPPVPEKLIVSLAKFRLKQVIEGAKEKASTKNKMATVKAKSKSEKPKATSKSEKPKAKSKSEKPRATSKPEAQSKPRPKTRRK